MSGLTHTEALIRAGRFSDALHSLATFSPERHDRVSADVWRAHLLERTGRHEQAVSACERLLRHKGLSHFHKSMCEMTIGIVKHDLADPQGTVHFRNAVTLAESSQDLRQVCWTQLRLMIALADGLGPLCALPVLNQVRTNAVRLGDPQISAALHIFVGEMEARRGLLQNARRHTQLGLRLLGEAPNLWLEARAENTWVALSIMQTEIKAGIVHGQRALSLALESGSAGLMRACYGNLGILHYLLGEFDQAVDYYERADAALFLDGRRSSAALDSLAKTRLRQGKVDDAFATLEQIEQLFQKSSGNLAHANRYSHLTRVELLERRGLVEEALEALSKASSLATRADDQLLRTLLALMKAELLIRAGRREESTDLLSEIANELPRHPPDVHAQYERACACSALSAGDEASAYHHLERARRIYQALHHRPGLLDLDHAWNAMTPTSESTQTSKRTSEHIGCRRSMLQDVAGFLMHIGRPELLAIELVSILAESGAATSAVAFIRTSDTRVETLATHYDTEPDCVWETPERVISIGSIGECSYEVVVRSRPDPESVATLNAVELLIRSMHELERAKSEREERLMLWPAEEVSTENEHSVVAGQMRELVSSARKIAATTVSVLITGESGTGKEILARAIHRYSSRADKPFISFNCAAIPREMLESQLFGHRRGAFTGADRDSLGLIRAAKNGTLFLDEIGELCLDLQPKLLRFLESGEINPLGEPTPFNIDVRIVAATNSNLEQLVKNGKFREDLFYRLNVFPLTIPPLRERRDEIPSLVHHFVAKAAIEFGKGQVRIAEETMEHLLLFRWPGNIRQLNNELRRMVALADPDSVLAPSALSLEILRTTPTVGRADGPQLSVPLQDKLVPTLSRIEREMIKVALTSNHGRIEAAARALGISRKGLYLKRQRLGI